MINPFDLIKLAEGKWVQLRLNNIDVTFGDKKIQGKVELDLKISEKLDD